MGRYQDLKRKRNLRVGDWVEVRSKEDILGTLDRDGKLDGMPFMPEMFKYCGQQFQVYKRAHKTCDYTLTSPGRTRRLDQAVHLQTRCDGEAHGGCQAGCLLYWKNAWLKPVSANPGITVQAAVGASMEKDDGTSALGCSESDVLSGTHVADPKGGKPTYMCQVTQVPDATSYINWWDLRQYIEDYQSGNVTPGRIFEGFVYSMYYHLSQAGIGVGPVMRWFYDKFHWLWRGTLFPRKPGIIPEGAPTPTGTLNLQPGELVRVKSHEEILKTVSTVNANRGMYWDAELVPYCGGTYKVLKRVIKIIDEKTGKMVEMKNPCIILDSVVCQARYSSCRMLCPKSMYPYWREIWLERVVPSSIDASRADATKVSSGPLSALGDVRTSGDVRVAELSEESD